MIALHNVSKSFGEKRVLRNVTLEVPDGQICFFLGKSGTGKSVLLKHLLGIMQPDEGTVTVDEFQLAKLSPERHRELFRRCGIVFQFPALLDSLTVAQNVIMAMPGFAKWSEQEAVDRSLPWLKQVGLGDEVANFHPVELSFGVQKRVAIARAMAVEPRHLLFDEPTTGLDPIASDAIHALIRKVTKEHGMTAIVVSHDLRRALAVADRLVMLDAGQIVFDGKPSEFPRCEHATAKQFLAANERSYR